MMRGRTHRLLSQLAGIEPTVPANGQDSVAKLAFAPLAFLPFSGDTATLAGILASAVAFLEGYSADEMETDLKLEKRDDASIVAHTHLKLVPYRNVPPALKPTTVSLPSPVPGATEVTLPSIKTQTKIFHEVSISAVHADESPRSHDRSVSPQEERLFAQYKNTFRTAPLLCDSATQSLLETTASPQLARAVFSCFVEAGLVAQPDVILKMMQRLAVADDKFRRAVVTQLEAECELGLLHFPKQATEVPPRLQSAKMAEPRAPNPHTGRGRFDAARAKRQRRR